MTAPWPDDLPPLPEISAKDPRYPCEPAGGPTRAPRHRDEMSEVERFYLFMTGELAASEICAGNVYEHDDLPWAFYRDMCIQAFDEARHAEINRRWLDALGARFERLRAVNLYYDGFLGLSLVGRLVALALLGEAWALDDQRERAEQMARAGKTQMSRSTERIMHEELRHVHAGLRWVGWLADAAGQPVADVTERAKAEVDAHFARLRAHEVAHDGPATPSCAPPPLARRLRRLAGMSDAQINAEAREAGREVSDCSPYLDTEGSPL